MEIIEVDEIIYPDAIKFPVGILTPLNISGELVGVYMCLECGKKGKRLRELLQDMSKRREQFSAETETAPNEKQALLYETFDKFEELIEAALSVQYTQETINKIMEKIIIQPEDIGTVLSAINGVPFFDVKKKSKPTETNLTNTCQ